MQYHMPLQPTLRDLMSKTQVVGEAEIISRELAEGDSRFTKSMRLEALWSALGNPMPRRRDIDPVALGAALLPQIFIMEVLEADEDFRFRLFGSAHAAQYGADLTGQSVSDLSQDNPSAEALRELLDAVVETRAPVYWHLRYISAAALERRASGILLPLSDSGDAPDAILGCATWT